VVDGQQRLTALTAVLARPAPFPTTPVDPWAVYFDAETQVFKTPPRDGQIPKTWVPVARLFDAAELSEWVHNWVHGANPSLRATVFQAGARIRQFEVPMYVVETDDDQLLRQIFYRINKSGRPLEWGEVYDALFGHKGERPSSLRELSDDLSSLGMGRPPEGLLLQCLLSFKGLDVTRNIAEHYRKDEAALESGIEDAFSALRLALSFVRRNALVPHLRLLPRSIPIVVLTRFFALFPEPSSRTLTLLTRWTWRSLVNAPYYDERTVLRHGVAGISARDEEQSVQDVLSTVPRERRAPYLLPARFDARAAESRLALVTLSSMAPRDAKGGDILDVASLIEERDAAAFRRVVNVGRGLGRSPANRILLPGIGLARKELLEIVINHGADSEIIRSHAITRNALKHLVDGDDVAFLEERKRTLEEAVERFVDGLAAWGGNDRPSIGYILEQAGDTE
jgi:hypothetical protein